MTKYWTRTALAVLATVLSAAAGFGADTKLMYAATAYFDRAAKGMKGPEGVACAEDSTVVVADTGNGRLLRYSFNGEQFAGGDEIQLPTGAYPTRVQIGSKGQIVCLDAKQHKLIQVAADGTSARYVELSGVPEPALTLLRSFRLDKSDNLYLLDPANARVVVTDPGGRFTRAVPLPADPGSMDDLEVDSRGTIFVLDAVRGAISSASASASAFATVTAQLRDYLNFATDFTIDGRGFFYLSDQAGGGIVYLGPDGSFQARHLSTGWKDGLLRHPAQLCVGKDSAYLAVADRDNNRVQVFAIK